MEDISRNVSRVTQSECLDLICLFAWRCVIAEYQNVSLNVLSSFLFFWFIFSVCLQSYI